MSGADYAHCDFEPCLKPSGSTKVFYDADTDIPPGTVIMHGECAKAALAAAGQRGYQRAIDALRDEARYDRWWTAMHRSDPEYGYWQKGRVQLASYLEALATQPTDTTET